MKENSSNSLAGCEVNARRAQPLAVAAVLAVVLLCMPGVGYILRAQLPMPVALPVPIHDALWRAGIPDPLPPQGPFRVAWAGITVPYDEPYDLTAGWCGRPLEEMAARHPDNARLRAGMVLFRLSTSARSRPATFT